MCILDRPSARSGAFPTSFWIVVVLRFNVHATETVPPMMGVSQVAFLPPFLLLGVSQAAFLPPFLLLVPSENRRDPLRVRRELAPFVLMLRWLVLCELRELMLRMLRELRKLPESEEFMLEMEL